MSSAQTSFLSAIFSLPFSAGYMPCEVQNGPQIQQGETLLIVSYLPLNLLLTPPVLLLHHHSPWHLHQKAGGIPDASLPILFWVPSCSQSKHHCALTHTQCFISVPVTVFQHRAHICNPWKPLSEFLIRKPL